MERNSETEVEIQFNPEACQSLLSGWREAHRIITNPSKELAGTKFLRQILPKDFCRAIADRDSTEQDSDENSEDKSKQNPDASNYIRNADNKIETDNLAAGKDFDSSNAQGKRFQDELEYNIDLRRELMIHLKNYVNNVIISPTSKDMKSPYTTKELRIEVFNTVLSYTLEYALAQDTLEYRTFSGTESGSETGDLQKYENHYKIAYSLLLNLLRQPVPTLQSYGNILYIYFYVALYKKLPYVSQRAIEHEQDYWIYRTVVLDSASPYSMQGKSATYNLALKDGNTYALYAMGQMEYHSQGPSNRRNVPVAYECYKKILQKDPSHPSALYAINNIRLDFIDKRILDKPESELYVEEINQEYKRNPDLFEQKIAEELQMAYLNGNGAAANYLGLLIRGKRNLNLNTREISTSYIIKPESLGYLFEIDPLFFFEESIRMGYFVANISKFNYMNEKICGCLNEQGKVIPEKREQMESYINIAKKSLMDAADNGVSIAANQISQYHLRHFNKDNIGDIVFGEARFLVQSEFAKDTRKAFDYAYKALTHAKLIRDNFWPFYNIVKFFYFNENDPHYYLNTKTVDAEPEYYPNGAITVAEMHELLTWALEAVDKSVKGKNLTNENDLSVRIRNSFVKLVEELKETLPE